MPASANPTVMSVEEYLESERHSAIKHEYVDEVVLESIGFKCPLAAFYEDVGLPEGREQV